MVATLGGRFNDGELFGSPFMLNLLKHELFDQFRAGQSKALS